ncbi:MAG: ATP-binding protein, partial [Alphaproteobacteria bacterium]|nr:ATP-binding protein [Alphaproteobacteria bacterium]
MKRNNTNITRQKNTLDSTPRRESGYLSLSPRFSKHLNDVVLKKTSDLHYLFLTGDAGCGKTAVLKNEFLYPLKSRDITLCLFNFLPDRNIHNHFFLNDLVQQLIKAPNIAEDHPEAYKHLKRIKPTLKKNKTVHLNQHELLKDFTRILTLISRTTKIVFLFEDIHLAGKNFGGFLTTLSNISTTIDVHVISSSRKNKTEHKLSFATNRDVIAGSHFGRGVADHDSVAEGNVPVVEPDQ